ncbi:hypothetical protein QEJ31_05600 [Pigmentibacter sp. JX0631]|uniref:hypothetical protein n=1 Tax=Pigmentibacter sp. JX0631 TaxID=2976982 RepID=UPI0024687776|nr:hypothetical protein [Pigmentibacter sp. JX0631]WGL61068.1 hypothetical protein QEJ31_05600 [Pigmentibacter sp. JX0631]
MTDKKSVINETDLERHMNDQAARAESAGIAQKKFFNFQKLITKVYSLSDKEFDIAFSTLETMLENFNNKKKETEKENKLDKQKEKSIEILTNKKTVIETQKNK